MKSDFLALEDRLIVDDVVFGKILALAEEQTDPAPLDHFEKTDGNHILGPGIALLILLGGMVKHSGTAKNLLACLGIEIIVQGNQQSSIGFRLRDLTGIGKKRRVSLL